MTQAIERDPIYRCRRFQTETIELCVRWYITYRLSYRDLVAMMAERGVVVSHTTIMRWVLRYVPEFERRWTRYARRVNSSWRVDETAVSVRGARHYLYRAVDKHGKSVDFLLRADRGMDAAQAFFRRAVATHRPRWPRKVNLDGNAASHRALRLLGQEGSRWQSVVVRSCRYLNNVVEQDHRAIKRRCSSMLGVKSFRTAAITFAGIELANRIRKRQFSFGRGGQRSNWSLKQLWNRALACDANALDRQCTRTDAYSEAFEVAATNDLHVLNGSRATSEYSRRSLRRTSCKDRAIRNRYAAWPLRCPASGTGATGAAAQRRTRRPPRGRFACSSTR